MKTTLESNSRLGLLICLLLVICNTDSLVNHKQQHNVGFKVDKQITCPVCGLRSKDGIIGTSILRCEQFYAPHSRTLTNNGDSSRLPSFKCNCNYSYVNKRRCSSDDAILGPNTGQNKNVEGECLVAHVGMAIQGSNLLYRKWVSKENCFNICQRTRVKNGHSFDCTSFEHWHRNCDADEEICASFTDNSEEELDVQKREDIKKLTFYNKFNYNDLHKRKSLKKSMKRASKTDICVLSDKTIRSAKSQFLPNNAVTYYEVLCKDGNPRSRTKPRTSNLPNPTNSMRNATSKAIIPKPKTTNIFPIKQSFEDNVIDFSISNSDRPKSVISDQMSGRHCKFNPCLNGGACLMIDTYRFTCLCKDLYYGVYCEILGIKKKCHKTLMEIIIDNELADNLNIQRSDLFLNRINTPIACQLQPLNTTHARFSIPFGMCNTIKSNINGEIVYTNKLFSRVKTIRSRLPSKYKNDYLLTLECNFKLNPLSTVGVMTGLHWHLPATTTSSTESIYNMSRSMMSLSSTRQMEGIQNNKNCLIDLFQLRMRIFFDNSFHREYSHKLNNQVAYGEDMNVQFFVEYSDKLNELYKMQERLKYMHLTLSRCWLTTHKNPYSNIKQILVEDGCPKQGVKFYDSSSVKNSIQFTFKIIESKANSDSNSKTDQYYIHCDPEICIEPPLVHKETGYDNKFYSRFKSCKNITAICDAKIRNAEYILKTASDVEKERNKFDTIGRCNSTLVEGPLIIRESNNLIGMRQANSTACLLHLNFSMFYALILFTECMLLI